MSVAEKNDLKNLLAELDKGLGEELKEQREFIKLQLI